MADVPVNADPLSFSLNPLKFDNLRPGLLVNGQELDCCASEWKRLNNGLGSWVLRDQWEISLRFEPQLDFHTQADANITSNVLGGLLYCSVKNLSSIPCSIEEVRPFMVDSVQAPVRLDRCLTNGIDMVSLSRLTTLGEEAETSYSVIGYTDRKGTQALVLGFLNLDTAFFRFDAQVKTQSQTRLTDIAAPSLRAACLREGIVLEPGKTLDIAPLWIGAGPSLNNLMEAYAETEGKRRNARVATAPTGWCSWYYYYDAMTSDDLYQQMDNLNSYGFGEKVDYIQIDDGWNLPSKTASRNWGDWEAGSLFPQGMKQVADDIKAKGFKPGLWLAPFSVDPASTFFKENKELLIQGDSGPVESWGVYGLDLSHPGSHEFLRKTFTRVFEEWGFQYIKIDFLLHSILPGKRYDPTKTSAELLRDGLATIRQVAGDNYILGCGCPMGPAIGLVDGMRIGYDISSRWYIPLNLGSWPLGNCCVRPAMVQHAWRNWMHRKWWVNDADCFLVRDFGSPYEIENFQRHFPTLADPPYGLSKNEAEAWAQLVWLTGSIAMVGEDVSTLSHQRNKLLHSHLQVNQPGVQWVDWYEHLEVPVFRTYADANETMIAIFNITDEPVELILPADKLGVGPQWVFRNMLDNSSVRGAGVTVQFPKVSARTGMVWVLEQ